MTRRATIRTRHDRPDVVAAALAPDNTDEMTTRVERADDDDAGVDGTAGGGAAGRVVTTVERKTAGGLRTTTDDYVSNLTVAQRITELTTPP